MVMATNPIKSIDELKGPGKPITLGGDNAASSNFIFANIAKKVLGLNINVVGGYTGAAPLFLAMQSGEIDGQIISLSSVLTGQRDLWNRHALRALMQFGRTTPACAISRHPDRPRTGKRRRRPFADRIRRVAISHLAAVRGAARRAGGSRESAWPRRSWPWPTIPRSSPKVKSSASR